MTGTRITRLDKDPAWWNFPVIGLTEHEKASRRWAAINAQHRADGCQCGKPATEVRYDRDNSGSVPVEFWTCADHVDVRSWTSENDGTWIPND